MRHLIVLILIVQSTFSISQTFVRNYKIPWTDSISTNGITVRCIDGNIMSYSTAYYWTTAYVSKFDSIGNFLWTKKISYSSNMYISSGCALADSCIAFYFLSDDGSVCTIMKITSNGDLVWLKHLMHQYVQMGQTMAPDTMGGVVISASGCSTNNDFIHLDQNGHILYQNNIVINNNTFHNARAIDMVHDGADNYTFWGFGGENNVINTMSFFKLDENGDMNYIKEITLNDYVFENGYGSPARFLTKAKNGGYYCLGYIESPNSSVTFSDSIMLVFIDSFNNIKWIKGITSAPFQCAAKLLISTEDNGCLLIGSTSNISPSWSYSRYIKFDSTGVIEWAKTGWGSSKSWTTGLEVINSGYLHFMHVLDGSANLIVAKTDTLLNGFCNYNQIYIDTFPISYSENLYSAVSLHSDYYVTSDTAFFSNMFFLSAISCYNSAIITEEITNNIFSVYPNPADDFIILHSEQVCNHDYLMQCCDVFGKVVINKMINISNIGNKIDIGGLSDGIYLLNFLYKDRNLVTQKFLVMH